MSGYDNIGSCDICGEGDRAVRIDDETEANICEQCDLDHSAAVEAAGRTLGTLMSLRLSPSALAKATIDSYFDGMEEIRVARANDEGKD